MAWTQEDHDVLIQQTEKLQNIAEDVREIKSLLQKQNGRIRVLESWRDKWFGIKGLLVILATIVSIVLGFAGVQKALGAGDATWGGYTSEGSGSWGVSATEERSNVTAGYQHTAGSADTIKWIHYYSKSYTDNYAFCCAVYTVPESDSIASAYVDSVHCTSDGSSEHWDSTQCSIALTQGTKYTLALGNGLNSPLIIESPDASKGSRQATGSIGDSWTHSVYAEEWYCIYVDIDTSGGGGGGGNGTKVMIAK